MSIDALTVREWFTRTAENEDNVLALSLIDVQKSKIVFYCGEEEISVEHNEGQNEYRLHYHGCDEFITKLTSRLRGTKSANIINFMETFCQLANIIGDEDESMMNDSSYDAGGETDHYEGRDKKLCGISYEEMALLERKLLSNVKERLAAANCLSPALIQNKISSVGADQSNIFSKQASSLILIRDLLSIMQSPDDGIVVEPVNLNAYHWKVKYHHFDSESLLALDMIALEEQYGYKYLELDLFFTESHHSFYPPSAVIIRPRLQGMALAKVTTLRCLQIDNYAPFAKTRLLLSRILKELEEGCRVDLGAELNDIVKYPSGSYVVLEHLLMKLAVLSETIPRVASLDSAGKSTSDQTESTTIRKRKNSNVTDLTTSVLQNMSQLTPKVQKVTDQAYWAKGTGYGHGASSSNWDIEQYNQYQIERGKQLVDVLNSIAAELENPNTMSSLTKISSSANSTAGDESMLNYPRYLNFMRESALIPFIESFCSQHSFLEMDKQIETYRSFFKIIDIIAQTPPLQPLFFEIDSRGKHVATLFESFGQGLKVYTKASSKSSDFDLKAPSHRLRLGNVKMNQITNGPQPLNDDDIQMILKICDKITLLHTTRVSLSPTTEAMTSESSASNEIMNESTMQAHYVDSMKPLQYLEVGTFNNHHYERCVSSLSTRERNRRLVQDHSELSCNSSSMISWSSSVWFRAIESRMDIMQVMISGPEGTPYSNGLFIFDVHFDNQYPIGPPKVNLQTTGRGTVRFNPNLYNCGKVCLSLLGTWRGDKTESWNEKISTFSQVILSIQSLILVPEPYFNEPSYETTMHTSHGKQESANYNKKIRISTIQWAMIDHIRNPSPAFDEVIRLHFRLKRDEIRTMVLQWSEEDNAGISLLLPELEQLLSTL